MNVYQMIPSFIFKRRAWTAIKPWLQVLVVIGLLAVLPGLVYDTAMQLMSEDVTKYVLNPAQDVLTFYSQPIPEDITEEQAVALLAEMDEMSNGFMASVVAFVGDKGWILLVLGALSLLLTPVVMTPMHGALLDASRKKELTVGGCLGYLRLGMKALLLALWTWLRIWLWMVPGMVLTLAALLVPALSTLLLWVGFGASMVLGIRAALHYCLAPIVLVDKPDVSINGCIRESWQVMRTRKMEYFMLRISFVGWELLLSLVMSLALNRLMLAVCLTITMMGNLLLTLYVDGATVAFWDSYGVRHESSASALGMEHHPDEPGDDLN